jgi:aconitate hydratase
VYYPDTLVGTDSHTTMINGIGVVGWGVGGIEAEAAMLGQPVYFLTPDVVGFELTGRLREGCTATDLVLTVTEILRQHKVVGKFVEFFGEGTRTLALPDRATIANMAPEYGATMGFFPVDERRSTTSRAPAAPRPRSKRSRPTSGAGPVWRAQGGRDRLLAGGQLDLGSVTPSLAGPKRPQDRIELGQVASQFTRCSASPTAKTASTSRAALLHTRRGLQPGGAARRCHPPPTRPRRRGAARMVVEMEATSPRWRPRIRKPRRLPKPPRA